MPNWCANSLKLIATTAESESKLSEIVRELARAAAANDNPNIFNLIKPVPEALMIVSGFLGDPEEQAALEEAGRKNLDAYGYTNWYEYCVGEWGTKWDAKDATYDIEGNKITIYFDTAWSPPMGIYHALEDMGFDVEATYVEQGMGYIGYYKNGTDTCTELKELETEEEDPFENLITQVNDYFASSGIGHSPMHMGG